MTEPRFHPAPAALDLESLVALTGARAHGGGRVAITGVSALDRAGPGDLAWLADEADADELSTTRAGACLASATLAGRIPARTVALVSEDPRRAFARVARELFPAAARPEPLFGPGTAPGAVVHPDARLEPDVAVDPGAVIGPGAEIGRGAVIGANAVVGAGARIGRGSAIGHGAVVTNALLGDRVVVGPGARLGHAAPAGAGGASNLGRVIVQDDVVLGANVAIARGRLTDTVVGENSLLGDLVSLGPDAVVGRGCAIFSLALVAEAAILPDFSVLSAAPSSRPAARLQGPS